MDAGDTFQTTLLILYFVGQPPMDPKNIPKAELETKINWTLQSTSQIETRSPEACRAIGNQLIERMDKVNTMTVRAYCLCADGSGAICKGTEEMSKARDQSDAKVQRDAQARKDEKGTVEVLGRPGAQRRGLPRN
ncbi:hypothetical protein [Rhodopseudomonas palustris]|uniref:Uncharacterized protein n=1 Tax=Rhodopseudomonas palustris TaxID=1076 RepID=A0A418VE36_RHOPL|nr:hypothetical protein [Rhodopseudomonas palustris]RJF74357.1 hypothetical protein D4Q52_12765 [Rhodopseudomonas palustris]